MAGVQPAAAGAHTVGEAETRCFTSAGGFTAWPPRDLVFFF
jgi:hypothetical protein